MPVEFADFTDEDLQVAEEAWDSLYGEEADRALRFNANHDAEGKFAHGPGGRKVYAGGHVLNQDDLDTLGSKVEGLGRAAGQEWHFDARLPRTRREEKLLDKTEEKDRFLVKEEVRPKLKETTREVDGGTHTTHHVGDEVIAETIPNPDAAYAGEEWISRQYSPSHPVEGGHDDFFHGTEKEALRDSRNAAKFRAKSGAHGYEDYHTPKKIDAFLDEQGASQARRRSPDADTYTHSYTLIHP